MSDIDLPHPSPPADGPNPDDADAWAGRGAALFAAERYADAAEAFGRALSQRPDAPGLYLGRGKARFENGDNEAAVADFDESLRLRPGHAETVCFRAAAYHCLRENEIACDELEEALRLDPALPASYFFRGRVRAGFGDDEGALADYDEALRLDPEYPYPYSFRASIWQAWGEAEKARADLVVGARRRPANAAGFHARAHQWHGLGEHDRAAADFAEAVRLEPDNSHHYSCRANFWLDLGDEEKADADLAAIDRLEHGAEGEPMNATIEQRMQIFNEIQEHFGSVPLDAIDVTSRNFPVRVAADLQLALDAVGGEGFDLARFYAVHQCNQPPRNFTQLYTRDRRNPPTAVPPEYAEIDVGEDAPVRRLKFGVWLLRGEGVPFLVLLGLQHDPRYLHFQVAAARGAEGQAAVQRFFRYLEDAVQKGACYRGKVLSLEYQEMYSGQSQGIVVHKLKPVRREQVILPAATVELLERNVVQFVRQRPRLARLGLATKKGLLFYGPPGTGKTHTIHYLAGAVPGQTTFLIAAEQVGMLGDYMTLARLFQPSMVVIEDVDLIARDRTTMHSAGEEALLNKLLNEMDGLKPETDVLFVLTTNRPEKLEEALASRPGRIDQAVEFPLPDAEGRAKLVRLYSRQVDVPEEVVRATAKRTERVSASFIKELMRRATQFYLEREGTGALELRDVEGALEEMLFRGGSLNRLLLGAAPADGAADLAE